MKTDTNTAISGLAALVEGPWAMEPGALRRVQARIADLARNAEHAHELRGLENTLAAVTGESTTWGKSITVIPRPAKISAESRAKTSELRRAS